MKGHSRGEALEAVVLAKLRRIAPKSRHTMVLGEALRNAGALEMPTESAAFVEFVNGPLRHAAEAALGDQQAAELAKELLRMARDMAVAQPLPPRRNATIPSMPCSSQPPGSDPPRQSGPPRQSSPAPGSVVPRSRRRPAKTLKYETPRPDVVVVDADQDASKALCGMFRQEGYGAVALDDPELLVTVCRRLEPSVVVVDVGHAGKAIRAKRELGKQAPTMVIVTPALGAVGQPITGLELVSKHDGRAVLAAVREGMHG